VNAESPANRARYLDPPFDSNGNPRYDLDANGEKIDLKFARCRTTRGSLSRVPGDW
jgi:hypothetical protein